MNCVVFIGTLKSGSSYEAITAAKSLDYYTVLLTDISMHFEKRRDFSNVDLMKLCRLNDLDAVRRELGRLLKRDMEFCAIVSFTEAHCHTAALLAEEFGLNAFTPSAVRTMLDKAETRRTLADTPYSPFFRIIENPDDIGGRELKRRLPLILKNPLSTGSKDVVKVSGYDECVNAIKELGTPALIEEYMDGPQFLVETLTIDGKVHIIAVVEQEISYAYRFIVTGYKIIIDRDTEFIRALEDAAKDIIKALGLKTGPCHLELRHTAGQWKLIEANPRISGGAMNRLIETAYGINLVKETLRLALGQKPELAYKYKRNTFAHYITAEKAGVLIKATGRNRALDCPGVRHVYAKPRKGQLLIPPVSMGNRYAYVIATGATADEAVTNAKRAAGEIHFFIKEIDAEVLSLLTPQQREALDEFYSAARGRNAYNFGLAEYTTTD